MNAIIKRMESVQMAEFTPEFARKAMAFAQIHSASASSQLASNLSTRIDLLQADGCAIPLSVNHAEPGNAWVCSPLTTYGHYAAEELVRYANSIWLKPLQWAGVGLCNVFSRYLRHACIDKTVMFNNWLLSTNLYPRLADVPLRAMLEQVRQMWPQHALWLRSLNVEHNRDWIDALTVLGFTLIPSRQVYLFNDLPAAVRQHKGLRRDLKLLRQTALQRIGNSGFADVDYVRISHLYDLLYVNKYSRHNPRYTEQFMRSWHRAGLIDYTGFRDDAGVLQAVVGIYRQGDVVTAPIVGYNTALPPSLGLYRLLMASVFEQSMQHGWRVNLSAGAAHFKRLRGGRPAIEYSAVLASHMPASTRRAVALLGRLTNSIGVPVMQRWKL
jgi:hypothetical protein